MKGVKAGQRVSVRPDDSGSAYKNEGLLLGMSTDEFSIETEVPGGKRRLRLHYPRSLQDISGMSGVV